MKAILPFAAEEPLKEEFFGHSASGFFVEVGANDPQRFSQSLHLEKKGWRGIVIEPQPDLAERHRQQRTARVFAVACSAPENSGKHMPLYLAGGHSSFDPALRVHTVKPAGTIEVPLRTLDEILVEAGAPTPIDFVSIDVEGHELDVLRGFDLARWRPRLVLLEDHVLSRTLHNYMEGRGYRWVRRTDINGWYVPADTARPIGWLGRWQFFRKYYLGTPFRRWRDALRRLRVRA
jgi:FkbM family methyltransferase